MQVSEIMSRSVPLIVPRTTIRKAARKMRDENIGALAVDENDRLVGMDGHPPRHHQPRGRGVLPPYGHAGARGHGRGQLGRQKRLAGSVAIADLALRSDDAGDVQEVVEGVSEPTQEPRRASAK